MTRSTNGRARKKTSSKTAPKKPAKKLVARKQAVRKTRVTVHRDGEYSWSSDVRQGYYAGRPCTYCAIDGLAIMQGDIVLGTVEEMEAHRARVEAPRRPGTTRALISDVAARWPGGVVPFEIDPALPDQGRIADAMAFFARETCIRFPLRQAEPNWVRFTTTDRNCHSPIGMIGGRQDIGLSSGCAAGHIAHEICHSLGLHHEQQRSDRDAFVTIHRENIQAGQEHNFDVPPDPAQDFSAYDFDSIMHYDKYAFSRTDVRPRRATITPKPPFRTIGQRDRLSDEDLAAINSLYAPPPSIESSDRGPAVMRRLRDGGRHQEILVAWKGNGNDSISVMRSSGGLVFTDKVTLNERTSKTPALAIFGDEYVLAWTGVPNDQINIMRSPDGRSWHDKVTLSDTSTAAPALVAVGGFLFLAWRGGDDRLNIRSSLDGSIWLPKTTLSETTTSGPALGSMGLTVLLAWRGSGNNRLNVMRSGPLGHFPGSKVTLNETTDEHPALCDSGSNVVLTWQGPGNALGNVLRSSDGGRSWSGKQTFAETALGGPVCTPFYSTFVRLWTESGPGRNLRARFFGPP